MNEIWCHPLPVHRAQNLFACSHIKFTKITLAYLRQYLDVVPIAHCQVHRGHVKRKCLRWAGIWHRAVFVLECSSAICKHGARSFKTSQSLWLVFFDFFCSFSDKFPQSSAWAKCILREKMNFSMSAITLPVQWPTIIQIYVDKMRAFSLTICMRCLLACQSCFEFREGTREKNCFLMVGILHLFLLWYIL